MKYLKKYQEIFENESIPGGKSKGLSLEDIAKKHKNTSLSDLKKQLKIGIEVEKEHTDSLKKAKEIAMDHLAETPNYYTKIIKSGLADEPKAIEIYKKMKSK
jgi:hypothetical protein